MTAPTDIAELDLEADHRALIDIFRGASQASSVCRRFAPCTSAACSEGGDCARQTREHFHRVLFGSMGRFGREERELKKTLSPANFQQHAASHADIMARLHESIAAFTRNRNVPAAFDMIESIARTYEVHHQIFDMPSISQSADQPYALPSSPNRHVRLPDLTMTGDAQIDSKHVLLHCILQQALTLCDGLSEDCTSCQTSVQQGCMNNVTLLIGDTLKHMVDNFRHEDALIRRATAYTDRDAHLRAHGDIARRIGQLVDDYEDQNTARCLFRLIDTLHYWLAHHVIDFDLALVASHVDIAAYQSIPNTRDLAAIYSNI